MGRSVPFSSLNAPSRPIACEILLINNRYKQTSTRGSCSFAYCECLTCNLNVLGLFIDVGTNYSVLDHTNLSFIYEDVLAPGPNADGEFVSEFCYPGWVYFLTKLYRLILYII